MSSDRGFSRAPFIIAGFVALLLLMAPAPVAWAAQDGLPNFCDGKLVGDGSDSLSYRLRGGTDEDPGPQRCEGQYVTDVSGSSLLVASVEAPGSGPPLFKEGRVTVQPGTLPGTGEVSLRVRSLKPRVYYFMDAPLGTEGFWWPSDIIEGLGLQGTDLGVVATLKTEGGSRIFLPVAFDGGSDKEVRVVIVPQRVATGMHVSVVQADESGQPVENKVSVDPVFRRQRLYPANRPVAITLPGLADQNGYFRVEVAVRLRGGGSANYDFLLYLP